MRKRVGLVAAAAITAMSMMALAGCASAECAGTGAADFNHRRPDTVIDDPQVAMQMLVDGNRRFVENNLMPRTTNVEDRAIAAGGQWPFAVIITCSDSRVAPELYFDQKMGDIFVIRNAGNVADRTALGALEFAVEHLGARLIVVVGHDACGAVHTAHAGVQGLTDNLQGILNDLALNIPNSETPEEAMVENVHSVMATVSANEVVRRLGAVVAGAYFSIGTGEVRFLD